MKKILCIVMIIGLLCNFASCQKNNNENESTDDMHSTQELTSVEQENLESLKFFKLPSPPVYKQIDDIDEINNIYNFVQTYPKERVLTPIDTNGWIYYLEFSNGIKISYCENILSINNEQYTVNNEFEKELSALYETRETEEKIYSSN